EHGGLGDMVRAETAARTALRRTVREYYDRGDLVPDELIIEMLRPQLTRVASWILDGFPRTEVQAPALDAALAEEGAALDRVLWLNVPDDELIQRLSGRRQSQATGQIYHVTHNPPPPDDP